MTLLKSSTIVQRQKPERSVVIQAAQRQIHKAADGTLTPSWIRLSVSVKNVPDAIYKWYYSATPEGGWTFMEDEHYSFIDVASGSVGAVKYYRCNVSSSVPDIDLNDYVCITTVVDGANGEDGADGHSPYIGTDGYWYVWEGDGFAKKEKALGTQGATPYPQGYWMESESYTRDFKTAPYVQFNSDYYLLNKEGTFTGAENPNPQTDYAANGADATWVKFDHFKYFFTEILLANFAKLGSAIFTENKLISQQGVLNNNQSSDYSANGFAPNLMLDFLTGKLKAKDAEIEGTVSGITGTFKKLQAVNESGVAVGEISFNSEGYMYFSGDMHHQGYDFDLGRAYRNYTSDLWCRGVFGAKERSVLYLTGTFGYFKTKGSNKEGGEFIAYSPLADSSNNPYINVSLYGSSGDASGFPVEMVIVNQDGVNNLNLIASSGKRVTLINSKKVGGAIGLYINGGLINVPNGTVLELINIYEFMNPKPASNVLGKGWVIASRYDNTW